MKLADPTTTNQHQRNAAHPQQISAFLTIHVAFSPESAGESQPDGVFSRSPAQRHSAGAEGEREAEEGGGESPAEQPRGRRARGEEAEGQPGEERQTHRGECRNHNPSKVTCTAAEP